MAEVTISKEKMDFTIDLLITMVVEEITEETGKESKEIKWICDIMSETDFGAGEVAIIDLCAYGSRINGRAEKDSDLDILLEYKGSAREDTVFNVLHDTSIYLQGIVVDINPIKAECSGTIEGDLKRC